MERWPLPENAAMSVDAELVRALYRGLLGREPESEAVVAGHVAGGDAAALARGLSQSLESLRHRQNPFLQYYATIDPLALVCRHSVPNPQPVAGHLVNFLGVAVDVGCAEPLRGRGGEVEPPPMPNNWHADLAEWGGSLRSVELAAGHGERFVVCELGCGWGCWLSNTGVAARGMGLRPHLIGVEGERHHIEFARRTADANGFDGEEVTLHHGIAVAHVDRSEDAGSISSMALFPAASENGQDWGLEPLFGLGLQEYAEALATGRYDELPLLSLEEVFEGHDRIDLLHVDIQGGERDLVRHGRDVMNERVAYVMLGLHSRGIEGQVMDDMLEAGWVLEVERPALYAVQDGPPLLAVDGVQGWRNPRLCDGDRAVEAGAAARAA